MSRMNYNRPNGGYERESWRKSYSGNSGIKVKATSLKETIQQEDVFIRGKFHGKKVKDIIKKNPDYCCWVLETNPKCIVAQQIINHFGKERNKQ